MAQRPKPSVIQELYLYSFADAGTGTTLSHAQRKKYSKQIIPLIGPKRAFNFWGEDTYLGRINVVGNASIVNESYLKQLRHADSKSPLFAINFVADINYDNSISLSGSNERTNSIEGASRLYRKNNVFLWVQCGPPIALKRAERVFPR